MSQNSQHHLEEVTIAIRIRLGTARRSTTVLKALIPDNVRFPKGLSLKMYARGSVLFMNVRAENIAMKTILNTIDEILEHVSVCEKVMPQ